MAITIKINSDRYLLARGNRYVYRRRVPKEVADLDDRAPIIQIPLKTDNIALARSKCDLLEEADNVNWSELIVKNDNEKARLHYRDAVKRAEAFGFAYKTSFNIAKLPIEKVWTTNSSEKFIDLLYSFDRNSKLATIFSS